MSKLSQYIGDTDIISRFRVRQLRVAVLVLFRCRDACYLCFAWFHISCLWFLFDNRLCERVFLTHRS